VKFRLKALTLALRRRQVEIPFTDVSYFWGQMGAGKTSIVRLVDYCLGGGIELTPALQSEFVGATLQISLALGDLVIDRPRGSDRVIVSWGQGDQSQHLNLPARRAEGEVLPDTGVEQLSDLLFWLSDVRPPRVRKSKIKEDSESARLSMRDLLWYCYLNQDEIDSSFFHLDANAPFYLRNKSRDVVRYVIGFHDERVAEIEAELDLLRGERKALMAAIAGLTRALKEVGVESEAQILERIEQLHVHAKELESSIQQGRIAAEAEQPTVHAADRLREQAMSLGVEIARIDQAIQDLREVQDHERRHLHELQTLSLKYRRSLSAKAVLVGVEFEICPRCAQQLPEPEGGQCRVCGQPDNVQDIDPTEAALVERDAKLRMTELTDILARHDESLGKLQRERETLLGTKSRIERERNEALQRYDTAYLSTMLSTEHERAAVLQEAENLRALSRLPKMLEEQRDKLAEVVAQEQRLRTSLKEAREAAESDERNLEHLKELFLDCLVRAGVPGITRQDRVEIPTTSYFPEVYGPNPDDRTVTSFATISSGGKKTLFKCCFAIALHRLAVEVGAPLPELLIIDSPMKNISERENREQFLGFYQLIYELASDELRSTQFILVDKEFSPPPPNSPFELTVRHMRPDDRQNPPLIPYYDGK